jgi:hypothetical protein
MKRSTETHFYELDHKIGCRFYAAMVSWLKVASGVLKYFTMKSSAGLSRFQAQG